MLAFDSAKLKRIILFFYHPATPDVVIRKSFSDIDSFHSFMYDKRNLNKCVKSYSFEYECSENYDLLDFIRSSADCGSEVKSADYSKLF